MGHQMLGPKKTRQLSVLVGQDVVHASAAGGYTYFFTTADHRHGEYSLKTGEIKWIPNGPWPGGCMSSCRRLFPKEA